MRGQVRRRAGCGGEVQPAPARSDRPRASPDGTRTLTLTAGEGPSRLVDLGDRGASAGDLYVFTGPLKAGGRTVGKVFGVQTAIALTGRRQVVQAMLTFRLGRGDEIVVGGMSEFPLGELPGTIKNTPYVRPILGGTGVYTGARGTLTSTRQANGEYRQRFLLLP